MLIEEILEKVVDMKGSDLHISSGLPPVVRVDGVLQRLDTPPLSPDDVETLLFQCYRMNNVENWNKNGNLIFHTVFKG